LTPCCNQKEESDNDTGQRHFKPISSRRTHSRHRGSASGNAAEKAHKKRIGDERQKKNRGADRHEQILRREGAEDRRKEALDRGKRQAGKCARADGAPDASQGFDPTRLRSSRNMFVHASALRFHNLLP